QGLTRRQFLHLSAVAAGSTILAACGAGPQAAQTPATTGNPTAVAPVAESTLAAETPATTGAATTAPAPAAFKESPTLAELVKAGKLPPIEQRLPKEPYVVSQGVLISGQDFTPGKYGGTMQLGQEAPSGDPHIFIGMNEGLLWASNGFDYSEGIKGNVVAGYEANEDDTVFTFHMREGLKWSDGKPVTMEDVRFAFEDVLYNEEITPAFPPYLKAGFKADAAPAKLTVIDDLTFSLTFDAPYGSFPAQLAIGQWRSYGDIIKPKHYLQQFHTKYTPLEKLKPLMKKESIPEDQWYTLFNAKQLTGWLWNVTNEQGIGHPVLTPWVIKSVKSGVFRFEANPYYFKVDSAGNQLPYMDGIRSHVVQDKEALTARALTGEFDYLGERASAKKLSLMAERAEKGEIKVLISRMHRLPINFTLNLTYGDAAWRKISGDVRFRKALSLAINRQEILDTFYLGELATLPKETTTGEYDVDQANQLLDEMGLDKKDNQGLRLRPDGKKITIIFEVMDLSEDHIPMAELIAEYWKKIGIGTNVRKIDGTVFGERWNANKIMATSVWAHHDIWRSAGWDDYLPSQLWGQQWHEWYVSQGKTGQKPPAEVIKLYEDHEKFMSATIGSPGSTAAMEAILKSHRDNVWTFNVVENSYYPTFFTTRMQNVPTGKVDVFGIIVTYSMEQWYIDQ
ncbi:MAG: ABC transporter substrate-binding protein, partial [Chloroflexota bacterium]|nr:ABC transporter substrate-binding protein [Chloroflexota bacterium]